MSQVLLVEDQPDLLRSIEFFDGDAIRSAVSKYRSRTCQTGNTDLFPAARSFSRLPSGIYFT